ncbi:hypothetical protein M0804_007289 [Polistes exclamans]|nr:hypothetical protein M0804_007289 [Polistes exclamans]
MCIGQDQRFTLTKIDVRCKCLVSPIRAPLEQRRHTSRAWTKELLPSSTWMTYLGHVTGNKFPLCAGTLNRPRLAARLPPAHDSRCWKS